MNRTVLKSNVLLTAAFLWVALVGQACDTTVDLPEKPPRAFSMYGSLSPRLDTQTVKVYPMGARLDRRGLEAIDATFTSENLDTGKRRVWKDSVMTEPDGDRVRVYWSSFAANYGDRYRVTMAGARRGTSSATFRVPEEVEVEAVPAKVEGGHVLARVRIPGAEQVLPEAIVTYKVHFDYAQDDGVQDVSQVDVRLRTQISRLSDGNNLVRVALDEERPRIARRIDATVGRGYNGPCCLIELIEMRAQIHVVNEEWVFPGDSISAETISQPGQMSNVENGFGFVGGGYRIETVIPVSDSAAVAAGFQQDL